MKIKKILSAVLATVILASSAISHTFALSSAVGTITNESARSYEEITLSDGRKTGVRYTEIKISGYAYGTNKVLRLAECDLSNTNLSVDVINCGAYTASATTVASAAKSFSKNGKTVLAALNGDLWMTHVNSNTNVTKKVLQATRGVMIIDREIWATQEFGMENYMNTSNASTVASLKSAFGVTSSNQPLVGAPVFTVSVTNETRGKTLTADGLNRLPAWDSLVVYNHRINSANYALNDSYEIELVAESTSFTLDNNIKARVVAIYPSGSTNRPSIQKNSIILTARGSRMEELSSVYQIGDIVSFDFSLADKYGRTELWQDVVDAIGGHMQVINDDAQNLFDSRSSEYPTSLIGIKDDGTVMFANMNASTNGAYKGLRYKDAYKLCTELGYNSVFYLDGGGSSSIVTLKDGSYTQRNYSSDGSARAVINAVAMVWNDTPVCEKQGSLAYLTTKEEFENDLLNPAFIPGGLLSKLAFSPNCLDYGYDSVDNTMRLDVTSKTNDPYINFDISRLPEKLDTSKYKYATVKLKSNMNAVSKCSLYFYTTAQSSIQNVSKSVFPSGDYVWVTFNLAESAGWSGFLTGLRIDLFEGVISDRGHYAEIEYIAFCETPRNAALLGSGSYPVGTIKNYYAFKDCGDSHSYSVFTKYDSAAHIKECSLCGYSVYDSHIKKQSDLIKPTCTSEGIVVYSCSGCGVVMNTVELPANGHTFSESFVTDKEPTATECGYKSRHCMYCDEVTDVTEIPPKRVSGDVDKDGKTNGIDANILQKFLTGVSVSDDLFTDINGDGSTNAKDMQALKRLLAGV